MSSRPGSTGIQSRPVMQNPPGQWKAETIASQTASREESGGKDWAAAVAASMKRTRKAGLKTWSAAVMPSAELSKRQHAPAKASSWFIGIRSTSGAEEPKTLHNGPVRVKRGLASPKITGSAAASPESAAQAAGIACAASAAPAASASVVWNAEPGVDCVRNEHAMINLNRNEGKGQLLSCSNAADLVEKKE